MKSACGKTAKVTCLTDEPELNWGSSYTAASHALHVAPARQKPALHPSSPRIALSKGEVELTMIEDPERVEGESVQPALSAEEWVRWFATEGREVWGCEAIGAEAGDRHALAALALHGQPFGFTHEDVAMLEMATRNEWESRADWGRLASLIARIRALLPPNSRR